LLYGSGDAVIGINPATDSIPALMNLFHLVDEVIGQYGIPTQSCILTHVTNQIQVIEKGAPVDLIFQSIAGTEKANKSFGINLGILKEAQQAAHSKPRHDRQQRDVF
jgi:ethanolamine ammonia-lyase large subunit